MSMPKVGAKAPDFSLLDQNGQEVSLASLAGRYVVLYFYPKDDTPGCTVEACNFRDDHSALQAAGAQVLGVSPDSAKSHQRFATKYALPFPLLVDAEHQVADAYGAWAMKKNYGREYMGIVRSTFLIGPDGTLLRVWDKVKVKDHSAEVLQALRGAAGGTTELAAPAAEAGAEPKKTVKDSAKRPAAAKKPPASKVAVDKPQKVPAAGRKAPEKAAKVPAKKAASPKLAVDKPMKVAAPSGKAGAKTATGTKAAPAQAGAKGAKAASKTVKSTAAAKTVKSTAVAKTVKSTAKAKGTKVASKSARVRT